MADRNNSSNNAMEKQYIVFEIESEMYGISVKNSESIERMTLITRVPDSLDYVLGIINLRGDILPVLSLRRRIGLEPKEYDPDTRVIVFVSENYRVGLVADKVVGIINIPEVEIQPAKNVLADRESFFLESVYNSNASVIMLLNMDIILNVEHSNIAKEKRDVTVI